MINCLNMQNVLKKKRKLKGHKDSFDAAKDSSFQEGGGSMGDNEPNRAVSGEKLRQNEQASEKKLKNGEEETMGGQSVDESLARPYEFLKFASPPIHMIFFPHFTVKSVSFVLSVVFVVAFLTLVIYSSSQPDQTQLTWNCSIFQLQNKYFPRIRYSYQLWRVLVSGVFHSNIAHFFLNLISFQIYAYFVEWYYGKLRFGLTLLVSVIISHLFSCVALPTTVSTLSSSILYATLALKAYFLFEYREYKPLFTRRIFIYILLCLISVVNLIPIFTSNNVDYTTHLGGLICGALIGLHLHLHREEKIMREELTKLKKGLKYGVLVLLALLFIVLLTLLFAIEDTNDHYKALNNNIVSKCAQEQ